jgi:alpha-1,2-mannosyltransferase
VAQSRSLVPLASVAFAFGLYGWAVFAFAFRHDGVIGPVYNFPGTDFMVYYGAARAALEGHLALLFDGDRFTQYLNLRFHPLLRGELPFHPWVYPPYFLLLLLPFALVPFGLACFLFLALSFVALVAALGTLYRGGRLVIASAALLLAPAASITAVTGQNAFLTAALLLGGASLAATRPLVAGMALGALTYKPQFFLMVPVALVAARNWRALAATGATALALALASLLAFGIAPWQTFAHDVLAPGAQFRAEWRQWSVLFGDDVFASAVLLGAPDGVAKAAQGVAALVAAGAVFWAWRGALGRELRLAVLLAASCLAAPHLQGYDMVLLAAAAALFLIAALDTGLQNGDAALALALFLLPLFNPPRTTPAGFATPIVELLVLAVILMRAPTPLAALAGAAQDRA